MRRPPQSDFKTANLLFSEGASPTCAAYDFQYVGAASPMRDVAYLLCSGVQARLLQGSGEEALLRHYHAELLAGLRALADAGGSSGSGGPIACPAAAAAALEGYSYEALFSDYQVALCDYVRWMAGWGMWGNASWAQARARTFLQELGLGG